VVNDDVLFGFRLRLFGLAQELGNVRAACRIFGVHPSTSYRWRGPVLRSGLEMLRPRERRPPRMPNQTSQLVEQRVIAFSLGHPGLGPRRVSATLAQVRWGGIVISPNGVWRVLRRHGLNRRINRLSLVAGYAAPPEPERVAPLEARHVAVDHPGELVGFDCSTSVGCRARRAASGSTPRSTSRARTSGPSSPRRRSTRRRSGPRRSLAGWRPTWPVRAGGWSGC
jgi:transposase